MAKIYVAGKKRDRSQAIMEVLKQNGHQITFDWTSGYKEDKWAEKALIERDAIKRADLVVYLWERDQESARYEAGMAMGLDKPLIVSGGPDTFFFKLPNIYMVPSDNEIVSMVSKI